MARDPSALHSDILEIIDQDLALLRREVGKLAMDKEQRTRLRELNAMVVDRRRVDIELEGLALRGKGEALSREESLAVVEQLVMNDPEVRSRAKAILAAS